MARLTHFAAAFGLATAFVLAADSQPASDGPVPLLHAHSHNDYMHGRPLLDALECGFCSIEADIHLVDGQLLVAHERWMTRPQRTLQALYLDPLRERVRANGGRVYRGGPTITLLIELKTDADTTYPALREVLESYREMLTVFREDKTEAGAVTVLITGNLPRKMMAEEKVRLAGLDGSLGDLKDPTSNRLCPLISSPWKSSFKWSGKGTMPAEERKKLDAIVARAHAQGRQVRFWGAPDTTVFWQELRSAGVDWVNTDNLKGLRDYLLRTEANSTRPAPAGASQPG